MAPEVTKACLTCHNKAGHQFQKSIHWTWEYKNRKDRPDVSASTIVVNNFCTNARGNEGMCAMCHASYNWTSANFDFNKQENIDCLVCHDRTATSTGRRPGAAIRPAPRCSKACRRSTSPRSPGACGTAGPRELRNLPLQRRRRRRRQAPAISIRRSTSRPRASSTCIWRRGRAEFRLHRLPCHQRPPDRPAAATTCRPRKRGRKSANPASAPRGGDLQVLSRQAAGPGPGPA